MGIKQLLAGPDYPDDAERDALARIFHISAVAIVTALSIAVVNNLLFSRTGLPIVIPATAVIVGALIAAARLGYLQIASTLLPPVMLAASAYFLWIRDGVHDTGVIVVAGTLVIGGILLTRRAMVTLTIAAVMVILGVGYAEISGLQQNRLSGFTDLRYLVGVCLALLVIAITARVVAESLFTSLRQAQEKGSALGASEGRYRMLVELSPDAIYIISDERFVFANAPAARLFGAPDAQSLVGRHILDFVHPDARPLVAGRIARLNQGETLSRIETTIMRLDGSPVDVEVASNPFRYQDKPAFQVVARDITERRRAERLLEESERRLAKMIDASPESITITTLDNGVFVEANPACEQLYGYAREELIGRSAVELGFWTDQEDRRTFIADLRRHGVVEAREVCVRRRSGELREVLASGALIEFEGRQLMLFQAVDVTERRRAEHLLEESEARLAKMIEASPEAITIGSVESGTFIEANPACEQLTGYAREELIGRSPVELGFWPDPEERGRFIADLRRDQVVRGRELRLTHKGGELRDILASAAIIDLKDRKFILFQAVDITKRKSAEKALREHELMLRELSAHHDSVREGERAHIAREIHDEMGQALTALKMDLSVLTMKFAETTPQISEQVQELKARVDAIIQVVRDVATALRPAALDLGIMPGVEWLVEEFRKRSGIRCTVSVADSDVALGEDRSIVLFRIVQESLTNVSRHANARNVEILLDHDAERIRLDIEDDGVGFDVDAARRKKTFGLLGIQERVIMLRGELSIASAPGRGTRVSVSMPIA